MKGMLDLRYLPMSAPSGPITAAVLKNRPSGVRSKMGAIRTMPVSRATAAMRSMVGPGIGSAHSKYSRRVSTQKYIVLKSSDRHTMRAPCAAACRTRRIAVSMFASLLGLRR